MPPKRHRDDKAPTSSKKFKVGDLVNVAPRPGPGKNSESGVARVTGIGIDGYNVKFVVGSAGGVAVAPTWLSAVAVDANSGELPARTPRTPRNPSAASSATPSAKSTSKPKPAATAVKTPRASAAKPAASAAKLATAAKKVSSTPKSTARYSSPAPSKASPKVTPKAMPKAKPSASTRSKKASPEAEVEEEEEDDMSASVSKTPPRGIVTVYGDESSSDEDDGEGSGAAGPPSPEFKHVGGGIRVGEDAFSDGTVGLDSLVAYYAKAKLKLQYDTSSSKGGAGMKGDANSAQNSSRTNQALGGESRGLSAAANSAREIFARLHWGLLFKFLALVVVGGLVASGALAVQARYRGLMPPEHLSGHPLLFEPNLVPEKTASELRGLLREVGAFRGLPTNQRDTSFYEAKREHVGEAVPLEPPDKDHWAPWCKHPFLAPNKRGDACVLPGRVDIGRHFVTTGGVDGLKEPYETMISRLLTFGFYVFDLSTVPAAQDLFDDDHFRQLARDVCPKHKPHLDPFQFNFILQLPGQTVAAHLDGVYFWGASRFDLPQWLLAAMQFAAGRIQLFKERFVDQVQVVAYLHEWAPDNAPGGFNNTNNKHNQNGKMKKRAGEFVYFTGDEGAGGTLESPHPRGGSAVDGTKTVHASQVYRPQDAPPPLTKDDLDARLVYFPPGSTASASGASTSASANAPSGTSAAADAAGGTAATVWTTPDATGTSYSVGPGAGAGGAAAVDSSSSPPPSSTAITSTNAGTWRVLRNGNEPLGSLYDDDDLRVSIVYRARCFESEHEANRYRAQLHRPGGARGEGPLSLDNVLEAFARDLHKQGLLPSTKDDVTSANNAAPGAGVGVGAQSTRHAGSSSASAAAAVASALEPTPAKRLALAMAILDTYVKYPYPTRAWLPFNYCALPRLVPWTATLLTPLCGRG